MLPTVLPTGCRGRGVPCPIFRRARRCAGRWGAGGRIRWDVQHQPGGNQPWVRDHGTVHVIQPRPRDGLTVEPLRNPRQGVPRLDRVCTGRPVRAQADRLFGCRGPMRTGLVPLGSRGQRARQCESGLRASLPSARRLSAWCGSVRLIFLLQRFLGTELTRFPNAGISPAYSARCASRRACPGQHVRTHRPTAAMKLQR